MGKSEKSPVSITAAERGSIDSSRGRKERRKEERSRAGRCVAAGIISKSLRIFTQSKKALDYFMQVIFFIVSLNIP